MSEGDAEVDVVHVRTVGNSMVLTIRKSIREKLGLQNGDLVAIKIKKYKGDKI